MHNFVIRNKISYLKPKSNKNLQNKILIRIKTPSSLQGSITYQIL